MCTWLAGAGLGHLGKKFCENRMDGYAMVSLTPAEYGELGVSAADDKKRLEAKLAKLLARTSSGTQPLSSQDAQTDDWSIDEVCTWLAAAGLGHLEKDFRANHIDGDALVSLTPAEYDRLGVKIFGDKKRLEAKHAELLARTSSAAPGAYPAAPAPAQVSPSPSASKPAEPAPAQRTPIPPSAPILSDGSQFNGFTSSPATKFPSDIVTLSDGTFLGCT